MMKSVATESDMLIPQHRLALLQHLATLVGIGSYYWWHSGSVHCEKAIGFVAKMRALYPIDRTPGQRAVAKDKRIANVELVMFPDPTKVGYVLWYLLATPGKPYVDPLTGKIDASRGFTDLIFQREPMKDGRNIPVMFLSHFQLVQRQKIVDLKKRRSRKATWTWALSQSTFREWQVRLEQAAKVGNLALGREAKPLMLSPFFSGVRGDVERLAELASAAFQKNHRSETYKRPFPPMLPYVTKVKVFQDATLYSLVDQLRQDGLEIKARAAKAVKDVLAGFEPPNQYTQSLKEKCNGVA